MGGAAAAAAATASAASASSAAPDGSGGGSVGGGALEEFDVYLIGEGGSSDSTRRLGFDKNVVKRTPTIGMVINLEYDKEAAAEKSLKSKIYHTLGMDWPLKECIILAEFLE